MENKNNWASAAPTLNLIFGMLSIMFAALFLGYLKPSAVYILGLIQIGVWPGYLIGSLIMLRSGDIVGGNTFFYFATFFGLAPGLVTVGTYLADVFGWAYDPKILGIMWLSVGLTLTFTIPAFIKSELVTFLVIAAAGIAIDFIGLAYLFTGYAQTFNTIAGVLLFFVGVGGIYQAVAGILAGAGIKLPLGKPIVKS
ncbi:MAG TPA: hypothetical protein VFD08_00430 [Clostridia bacterium]|nr:hypothetical protein [Clostridia bacterium]